MKAIDICKPGKMYREFGDVFSKHVEPLGFSVVRNYQGHGVGKKFHQKPGVPHYANNKTLCFMRPDHMFTIEPMVNQGVWNDVTWYDKWTITTVDELRSAQFEDQLLITEDGCEILSARTKSSPLLEHISLKPKA